jgi:uncharacterized protein (DUF4415 family)/uncharacterized DUF497 family protein
VRWTWNLKKAAANRVKHGLSFETAVLAFDDPFHASKPDPHPEGDRWHTIGLVGSVLLLVIPLGPRPNPNRTSRSAASSARGRPPPTKGKPMKKEASKRLTRAQLAELKSLAALPDSAIDTSDVPELLDWSDAKRGLFYRPVKQQLTLRLDADVVAWFKSQTKSSEGYQTRINRALREYVQGQTSRSRRSRA